MLGFVFAAMAESATGQNVIEQLRSRPAFVALTVGLITIASLVPILRGVPRVGNRIFSSDAEIVNGRFAMLGIASLFWIEWLNSSAIL